MLHGIIVINKERGLTSHQVVADLRRVFHQKEIGHTGTLDPEATGVLVVGLGQATRSFPYLNETIKIYRAEIVLGQTTDTQDGTGKVISTEPEMTLELAELNRGIRNLSGEVEQLPPMFSAVKVQGQKLYDLARRGLVVDRVSRVIKVHNWTLLSPQPRYHFLDRVAVEITCSKGTYIRTLIHDLGQMLGCGAHMGNLVRLQSGDYRIEDSVTVDKVRELFVQGRLGDVLLSLNTALAHLPPLWVVAEDLLKVTHGGKLSFEKYSVRAEPGIFARMLDQHSQVLAIAELCNAGSYLYWQPVKVFHQS